MNHSEIFLHMTDRKRLIRARQAGFVIQTRLPSFLLLPLLPLLLFRHSHDDCRLHLGIVLVDVDDLQSSFINQGFPFGFGAFDRAEERHHGDIHVSRLPRHADVRKHHFVDDDARMWPQGRNSGLQDFDTVRFGPIVEHMAEIIKLSVLDRLRLKEIVHVEFDPFDGLRAFQGRRDFLNDDTTGEFRELVSESDRLLTESTSDVD